MKRLFLVIIFAVLFLKPWAQELNCNVQINSDMISTVNRSVFNTLQKSISDFMNNRKWSEMTLANIEKIDCNLNIIIKTVEGDLFSGEIQVQSRRPVFNSSYTSTLFNHRDVQFNFNYKEFDVLEMNENTITSNLTAVLAYYAYIIIGYDMDSYSRLGGNSFFNAAQTIVNAAQAADLTGWKAFENNRNRYALINNLLDEAFSKYRNFFYEYHRLGLDEMSINMNNARARIAAGLPLLREANRARPNAVLVSSFIDAKSDELINIFSKAPTKEKEVVVRILSDIAPTQSERFERILK